MAKGSVAKVEIQKKLAQAFGGDFIGEYNSKIYVWANDGGEMVQIAMSLTCPKNPIQVDTTVTTSTGDWDFSDNPKVNATVAVANAAPAEITAEEKANIADLMAKLGL